MQQHMDTRHGNPGSDDHTRLQCSGRYLFVSLALMVLASHPASAQTHLRLGLATGANVSVESFSAITYQGYPSTSGLGFFVGGLTEIGIADHWSLQAEPTFIEKGTTVRVVYTTLPEYSIDPTDFDVRLTSFEIPLLLKATIGNGDLTPFAFAGPSIGLLPSATDGTQGQSIQGRALPIDIKDRIRHIEIASDLGVGLEYRLSPSISLRGSARYFAGVNAVT